MDVRLRSIVATIGATALLFVAACGDDDDNGSTATSAASTTTAATATTGASATTAAPATTAASSATTAAPATTGAPATTAAAELTDSYRGVTADSIKLGVLLLDLKKLKDATGLDLMWGNVEGQYDEAIATINDSGGVLGRQIDPVYVYVDPLSETGYQEACVQLTEDEKVFAAIGFVRPADTALCYTETGDTPFLGYLTDITQDVFDRTVVSLVTTNPVPERLDEAMVNVVADTGAPDGKKIAVLGNDEERNQGVADAATARGLEVVDQVVTRAPSDDEAADSAELDVIIERWASLGVDYVFATSSLDRPLAAAHRAGFEADWAADEGSILSLSRFQSGATETEIARTVVVQEPSVEVMYAAGDEPTVACVDNWDQKHPEEVAVFYPGEGELDNLQHIVRPCNQLQTFALIAEAAGPDLTVETYDAAVASLGKYSVAMQPFASLTADKSDAGDVVALYSWDSAKGDFVAGPFIDIG